MARKDKILDILALATLPEDVKIAKLARKWVCKPFSREQAKAVIKCYFDKNGRLPELTQKLIDEKLRQEKIRNERTALAAAARARLTSPMLKYKKDPRLVAQRTMEMAKATFGQHVRDNFNEETLALMSLISGEDRWYRVSWLHAGFKPVRCALIEILTSGRVNPCQTNTIKSRFLIYKVNGRVLVARTKRGSLQGAWASQLPESFLSAVPHLHASGYTFRSDIESQEMVVNNADGTEAKRVPWEGRTVEDY